MLDRIRKEESVVIFAAGSPLPELGEMRSANVHDRAEDFQYWKSEQDAKAKSRHQFDGRHILER